MDSGSVGLVSFNTWPWPLQYFMSLLISDFGKDSGTWDLIEFGCPASVALCFPDIGIIANVFSECQTHPQWTSPDLPVRAYKDIIGHEYSKRKQQMMSQTNGGIRFRRWLLVARKDAGLTQSALANQLGVTPQTIGNWEAGRVNPLLTLNQVDKFCKVLDCKFEEIPLPK